MRLVGLDKNSPLYEKLLELMEKGTIDLSGATITQSKSGNVTINVRPRAPKQKKDALAAAEYLARWRREVFGDVLGDNFVKDNELELRTGAYNLQYWKSCTKLTDVAVETWPDHLPFSGPRNYAYPDGTKRPSIPIYRAGTETTGACEHTGAVVNEVFYDVMLRWHRYTFALPRPVVQKDGQPIFISILGTITGEANEQACRALLSWIYKSWLVPASSAKLTTLDPPVVKPVNQWFKYRVPRGTSPYWKKSVIIKSHRSARSPKYEEPDSANTRAVVLVSPAPFLGRRFNNNTSVRTTMNFDIELFMVKGLEYRLGMHTTNTAAWDQVQEWQTFDASQLCEDVGLVPALGGYGPSLSQWFKVNWYSAAGVFMESSYMPFVAPQDTAYPGWYECVCACVSKAGLVIATVDIGVKYLRLILHAPGGSKQLAQIPTGLSLNGATRSFYLAMSNDNAGNVYIWAFRTTYLAAVYKVDKYGTVSVFSDQGNPKTLDSNGVLIDCPACHMPLPE